MSNVNDINAHRQNNGQFGNQPAKPEAAVMLGSMTGELNIPYPTLPIEPGEVLEGEYSEDVTCVCNNTGSFLGFSSADRTGRLANIEYDETPEGLGEMPDDDIVICNSCGRVFDSIRADNGFPIIARVDTNSPEWEKARDLYLGLATNDLNIPYPTVAVERDEVATGDVNEPESATCVCGNTAGDDGFSSADRTGRLASIMIAPTPDGLGDLPDLGSLFICNSCGRVIDSDPADNGFPVLARVDTSSAEWKAGRDIYISHNFGD